jgi:uncharacterized protein (TIGR01732 family)
MFGHYGQGFGQDCCGYGFPAQVGGVGGCGYGFPAQVGGIGGCGYGYGTFVLIVVLFILLIIIGASYC